MPGSSRRRTARVLASHAASALAMSLPWPLLLVLVADASDSGVLLGLAAAARLAPYVALSWWVGRLADRHSRDRIVRTTLLVRLVLLVGVSAAVATDRVTLGLVLASLAVAASTPAYPALAAGMPRLAGPDKDRATELLVTVEVASFVVGPALGGLLLLAPAYVGPVAVALAAVAVALYAGVRQPAPAAVAATVSRERLRLSGPLRASLLGVMLVNALGSATAVALLPLADDRWSGADTDAAYGLATAVLGLGALAGPLLGAALPGGDEHRGWRPLSPGLLLMGLALAAVALSPATGWALVPLLVVGAAAVQVEAAATRTIQREAGDEHSAGVLGLADTLMVSAGLVGAVTAPVLAAAVGVVPLLAALGVVGMVPALGSRLSGALASRGPRQPDPLAQDSRNNRLRI